MTEILNEVTRSQLLNKSKNGDNYAPGNQSKGKNRYERRVHSSISNSVAEYSRIDMNSFFKRDILTFSIEVKGETDTYKVKIKLNNVLNELKQILKNKGKEVEHKDVLIALTQVFEHEDVYVFCNCPDFKYRGNYYAAQQNYNSEPKPSGNVWWSDKTRGGSLPWTDKPIKTNPLDSKGAGCKHILLVLNNKDWIMKLASTINNYIKYMKEHQERLYQTIIFPALYDQRYSDDVQMQLFDPDTNGPARNYLRTNKKTIGQSNAAAKDRTKFKQGNTQGVRFAKDDSGNDIPLDLDRNDEYEETK